MLIGCKNPLATNFNPAATQENYSCVYLLKAPNGDCHYFKDFVPSVDDDLGFTMSYSIRGDSWVFFHDYKADMYIHTREKLYSLKSNAVFEHHAGAPGRYYEDVAAPPKPYFIDVVFRGGFDIILEVVNWVTEYLSGTTDQPFKTLTHIQIWNSHQHTGRIELGKVFYDQSEDIRRTKGEWSFNDFRNILVDKGPSFLKSIFKDYALDGTKANAEAAWYMKELLIDKWFCVRFEFDNTSGAELVLHDTTVQAIKSDR